MQATHGVIAATVLGLTLAVGAAPARAGAAAGSAAANRSACRKASMAGSNRRRVPQAQGRSARSCRASPRISAGRSIRRW